MTLALAGAAVLAACVSLLPASARPWNLSPIGALGLFAAARLGFWPAVGLLAVALGLKDLGVYLNYGMEPAPLSWLCFLGYVALGYLFLRRTEWSADILERRFRADQEPAHEHGDDEQSESDRNFPHDPGIPQGSSR